LQLGEPPGDLAQSPDVAAARIVAESGDLFRVERVVELELGLGFAVVAHVGGEERCGVARLVFGRIARNEDEDVVACHQRSPYLPLGRRT
jgi:hypothetical protein